ncbi:serine/threonine protein kinase [Histoplasma capsulatum var. duboisii H88]|uniref:non-specific serine/threonine protein kinase n=1 Tax=Ajellomyces capsulatus (strain H88) TaxID=544711 RepID=A0A8A1L9R1_AJEC8|nr:serine/threonine protein kinase [Histoplasma capsulatum var. duboisii H88]
MTTMDNPNLILTLKAYKETPGVSALQLQHNSDRYIPPPSESDFDVRSREATPFLDPDENNNDLRAQETHRLCFTFDHPPMEIGRGFSFGTDRKCDVLLAEKRGQRGISGFHFYITFDDKGYLIIKDESTNGTAVSYDGWGAEKTRHHFKWILFPERKLRIHLPNEFYLEIEFANHETCQTEYHINLMAYLREKREASLPHSFPDIHSHITTALPSQRLSPRKAPIYLPGNILGKGTFGTVRLVTDVSTAEVYAAKEFHFITKFNFIQEVEIMRGILHRHIVRFIAYDDETQPQLIMEYLPLGNLADQHRECPLSGSELRQLLLQGLDALQYLHSLHIVHRDIKPENILVQNRHTPLHIKLADFGLSKDLSFLKTTCGTPSYVAPEVLEVHRERLRYPGNHTNISYDRKVDLWSLGVVVLEYADSLPNIIPMSHEWYQHISMAVEDLSGRGTDQPMFTLLQKMLQIQPEDRPTAIECFREACDIGLDSDSSCVTPTKADNGGDHGLGNELSQSKLSTQLYLLHSNEPDSPTLIKRQRSSRGSIGRPIKRQRDEIHSLIVQMFSDLHRLGILRANGDRKVVEMLQTEFSQLQVTSVEIVPTEDEEIVIKAVDSSNKKFVLACIEPSSSIRDPLDLVLQIVANFRPSGASLRDEHATLKSRPLPNDLVNRRAR